MSTVSAASKQHLPGGSPQKRRKILPPVMALPAVSADPRPAAKKDASPASSAATLTLDFWVDQMDVDDDWDNILKHNPPRDVTLAYTDFLLSQPDDGQCHCQWVTYFGKWELWQCKLHKYQK